MSHPILALQGALIAAVRADTTLAALVGSAVFDAPPKEKSPPYVVVARHDVAPRDGDAAPGHEHRVLVQAWAAEASRKSVLALCDRVVAVALTGTLAPGGLVVTHRVHDRTETSIDGTTGFARAAITLRFFTEPTA